MSSLQSLAQLAKAAAPAIANASTTQKNNALETAAELLVSGADDILTANERDLASGRESGISATVLDRLRLDESRIMAMANGLRLVAGLPDPIGEVTDGWVRPNGIRIQRVRVPLGVIGIIYENRPNVTSDAAALCLKSGNVAFLRGSSGAIHSNRAIAKVLRAGVVAADLPEDIVALVDDTSRESAVQFMQLRGVIDCLIPRGGVGLIQSILDNATVPYVIDGDGNCHIYIDESADVDMALRIVKNAKTQRPSVCNAAESLLVHEAVAKDVLPRVQRELAEVTFVGDASACAILPDIQPATEADFRSEFLELKMSVAVVRDIDEAIEWIARNGSGHSEAIVADNVQAVEQFTKRVDAAAVVVNASTRLVDGEEFGFGAEIGISTQKLHARGPMGLQQLTTLKYIVHGTGQIREERSVDPGRVRRPSSSGGVDQ
jgi:glutamate-5-semialdehyde dehydrogenase